MTNDRLFIGWREAELRAKLDGSYDKQDDLRHERDALRAENERLQRENGSLARTYAACEDLLRQRTGQFNQADAENERLREERDNAIDAEKIALREIGAENERLRSAAQGSEELLTAACDRAAALRTENERLRAALEQSRQEGLRRGAELAVETLEGQRDGFSTSTEEWRYLNQIIDGLRVGLAMALATLGSDNCH